MFLRSAILATCLLPAALLAAGGGTQAPKPTETTTKCEGGQVWDEGSKSCVDVKSDLLDDDALYGAVREFAYAGQLRHAQTALAAMSDQSDSRVLTYWGYTHRKLGQRKTGMAYYRAALRRDPGNILARSYMGQAMVEAGYVDAARHQLEAIRTSGGAGSWAETSLAQAIETGRTYSY